MDFTQDENAYSRSRINKRSSERRSSILKIPAGVLSDLDPNSQVPLCASEPPVKKIRRCSKRVSFAESCQVKEFIELSPNKSAADQVHVSNEEGREVADASISGLDKLLTGNIQAPSSTSQQSELILYSTDTNYENNVFEQTNVRESSQVLPDLSVAEPLSPSKQCSPTHGSDTFLLFLKNLKKRNSDNLEPTSAKRGVYNLNNENDYSTLMNTNLNKYSISPNKQTTHSVTTCKQNDATRTSDKMTKVLSVHQSVKHVTEKENVPCAPRASYGKEDLMQSDVTNMDFSSFMASLNKHTEPNGDNIFNNEREIFDKTTLFANADTELDLTDCRESRPASGPASAQDFYIDLKQTNSSNIDVASHSMRRKSAGMSTLFDFDNMDMTDCLGPLIPVNMNESTALIKTSNEEGTDISHNPTTNSVYSPDATSSNQICMTPAHELISDNQSSVNRTQMFSDTRNQLEYTECVPVLTSTSTTEHFADETWKRKLSQQNVSVICNASLAEMDMTCVDVSMNGADSSVGSQRSSALQNRHIKNGSENIAGCVGINMRDKLTDLKVINCNQVVDSSVYRADGNTALIPIKVTDDEINVLHQTVPCAEFKFSQNTDTYQYRRTGHDIYDKTIVFRDDDNELELTECVELSNTNNDQSKLNMQKLLSSKECGPTNSNFLNFMKNLRRKPPDDAFKNAQKAMATTSEPVVTDKTEIFSAAEGTVDMTNCIGGIIISDGISQPDIVLAGPDKENTQQSSTSGKENSFNQSRGLKEAVGHQTFDPTIDKKNAVFKDSSCNNGRSMTNQKKTCNPTLVEKESSVNFSTHDSLNTEIQHEYDKTVVFTNVDNDLEITECIEPHNIDELTNITMSNKTDQATSSNSTNLEQENRGMAGSRGEIYLKSSATDIDDRLTNSKSIDKTVVFGASDDNRMDMTLCVGGVLSQNNDIVEKLSHKPGILKRRSVAPAEERTVIFAPSDDNYTMETTCCIGGILPSDKDNALEYTDPENDLNNKSEKFSNRPGILKRRSIVTDKTIMFASSGDDDMDMTSCIGDIIPSHKGELQNHAGSESSVKAGIRRRPIIDNDKTVVFSLLDDHGMEMTQCVGGIMTGHDSFTQQETASETTTVSHLPDQIGNDDACLSAVSTEGNVTHTMVDNLQSACYALAEENHTRGEESLKACETMFAKADVDSTKWATYNNSEKDVKDDYNEPENINTGGITSISLENTTRFGLTMEMTQCHTGVILEGRASTINISECDVSMAANAKSIYGNSSMDFTCGLNESSMTSQQSLYKRNDRTVHTELTMDFTNCQTTTHNRSTNDTATLALLEIDHADKERDELHIEQLQTCRNDALLVEQAQMGNDAAIPVKKPEMVLNYTIPVQQQETGFSDKENLDCNVLPVKQSALGEDYDTDFAAFQNEVSKTIKCIESHGKNSAIIKSASHPSDSVQSKRHRLNTTSSLLEQSQSYETPAVRGQKIKPAVNQNGLEKNVALLKGSQKLASNLTCLQNVLQHRKKSLSDFSRLSLQNVKLERTIVSIEGQGSDTSDVDSSKQCNLSVAESRPIFSMDLAPDNDLGKSVAPQAMDANCIEEESGSATASSMLTTSNANEIEPDQPVLSQSTIGPEYKLSISHGALSQSISDNAYELKAPTTHSLLNHSELQAVLNICQTGEINRRIKQSPPPKLTRPTIPEMETSIYKTADRSENSTTTSERLCDDAKDSQQVLCPSKKIGHYVEDNGLSLSTVRESAVLSKNISSVDRSLLGLKTFIKEGDDDSANTSCVNEIRDMDVKQKLLAHCRDHEMNSTDQIPMLSRVLGKMTEINTSISNELPVTSTGLQKVNSSQEGSSVCGMRAEDRTDKLLQGIFDVVPCKDTEPPLLKSIVHVTDHFTKLSYGGLNEINNSESEVGKQTLNTTRDPCTAAVPIIDSGYYRKPSDLTLNVEENNSDVNGQMNDGNHSPLTLYDGSATLAHPNETLSSSENKYGYRSDTQDRHETVHIGQHKIDNRDVEPMNIPPVVRCLADQTAVHHHNEEMQAVSRNLPDQMNVSIQRLSDLLQNETGFMEEGPPDFFDDFNKTANKSHDPRDNISYAGRLNSTLNQSVVISLPPHGQLTSPCTVDEFLKAFQISAFMGCAGLRRSSFLPPVVPSHALTNKDKLNIEFVQRVEVQVLEQALQWQMETNEKRLKQIQIREDHIAANNPSVFTEVGNASKTEYDDLKVHVKNCLAACRRQSQALFKAERVKQISKETDLLKDSQQQLSQINESISIAVEQIDQLLDRSRTVCGQLDDELKKRESFQNVDESLLGRLSTLETDIKQRESEYTSLCVHEDETGRKLSEERNKEQRLQEELSSLNKQLLSSTSSSHDPELIDNLCDVQKQLASLQRLHNWRLIDVCKESATFEFFEGLLDLEVIFNTTTEPHGIETLVVRSPINENSTPAHRLRQHLFTGCLTEDFLNLHPNKSDLPKLVSALSSHAKLAHDIALEVHFINLDHLSSLTGSQLCIEFRSVPKLVKFKLTITLSLSILSNQTPVIRISELFGHISEESITAVIKHVQPGKQYLTRMVMSLNDTLSEGSTISPGW